MTAVTFFTDTFTGTGTLDSHTSDSGQTWGQRPGSGVVGINLSAGAAVTSGTTGRFAMANATCPAGDQTLEFVFVHMSPSANLRLTGYMLIDPDTQRCFGVEVIRAGGLTSLSIYNGDPLFSPSITGVASSAMPFGVIHTVRVAHVGSTMEVSLDDTVVYSGAASVSTAGWNPLIEITSGVTNDTQILSVGGVATAADPELIDFWEEVVGASQI